MSVYGMLKLHIKIYQLRGEVQRNGSLPEFVQGLSETSFGKECADLVSRINEQLVQSLCIVNSQE